MLLDGVKLTRRMASLPALRALAGPELLPDIPADAAGDLEHWLRDAVRGSWHPTGTCAMGDAGDPLAVIDPSGRVHGVENLYVSDASVLPSIPRANTHLSVVAVAELLAERLRASS